MDKHKTWLLAVEALAETAEMYPLGPEHYDATMAGVIALVGSLKEGKWGNFAAWKARNAIANHSRIGFNEVSIDTGVMDGVEAALRITEGSNLLTYELGVIAMMDAAAGGDHERAEQLQKALWEYEQAVPAAMEPMPSTVFGPVRDNSLEERIREAYPSEELAETAAQANADTPGYLSFEDVEHTRLQANTEEAMFGNEYVPMWKIPEVDTDKVWRQVWRCRPKQMAREWKDWHRTSWNLRRVRQMADPLNDQETALFAKLLARTINARYAPGAKEFWRDLFFEIFDFNLLDEDVDYHWSEDHFEMPGYELEAIGRGRIPELIDLITLPPEDKRWTPVADQTWVEAGGALTSRISFQEGKELSKNTYFEEEEIVAERKVNGHLQPVWGKSWKIKQRRHDEGAIEVRQITQEGVSNKNGRSYRWQQLREMKGLKGALKFKSSGSKERFATAVAEKVTDPIAHEVVECLLH